MQKSKEKVQASCFIGNPGPEKEMDSCGQVTRVQRKVQAEAARQFQVQERTMG